MEKIIFETELKLFEDDIDLFNNLENFMKEQNTYFVKEFERERERELQYPIQERIELEIRD